jgi:hypothetical protein
MDGKAATPYHRRERPDSYPPMRFYPRSKLTPHKPSGTVPARLYAGHGSSPACSAESRCQAPGSNGSRENRPKIVDHNKVHCILLRLAKVKPKQNR